MHTRNDGTRTFAPGTLIAERYRIVGDALTGGMGLVFEAIDEAGRPDTDRRVALKFAIDPPGTGSGNALAREYQRLRAVDADSVVRAHGFGTHDRRPFIVMEWLDGSALPAFDGRDPMPPRDEALALIRSIAEALATVHHAGIAHADLNPTNVMRLADGRVKLVDFGNVRRRRGSVPDRQMASFDGTRRYLSPAVLGGGSPIPADDVFALGVVAYELLTGTHPFGVAAHVARNRRMTPKPLTAVPAGVGTAVLRALSLERESRYASAEGFLKVFDSGSRGVAVPGNRDRRRTRWLQAAGIAIVVVTASWLGMTLVASTPGDGAVVIGADASTETAGDSMPGDAAAGPVAVVAAATTVAVDEEGPPSLPMPDPLPVDTLATGPAAEAALAEIARFAGSGPRPPFPEPAIARPAVSPPVDRMAAPPSPEPAVEAVAEPEPIVAGEIDPLPPDGGSYWLERVRQTDPVDLDQLDAVEFRAPKFPHRARESAGDVRLRFAIAPTGRPVGIEIEATGSTDLFAEAVEDAVRDWRFAPEDTGRYVETRFRYP